MIALILTFLFSTSHSCFPLPSHLSGTASVMELRTGTTSGGAALWSARAIAATVNGTPATITPPQPLTLAATLNRIIATDPVPFTLYLCAPGRAPTILYFPAMMRS